jgi:hypothetical protein
MANSTPIHRVAVSVAAVAAAVPGRAHADMVGRVVGTLV